MEIVNVGCNYRHPSGFFIDRPSGSGDYILLIIRSDAYVILDGVRTSVPKNSVIVFKKGSPQQYGACAEEYMNDWIHFEMETVEEKRFSDLGVPFDTVIPLGESEELSQHLKNIFLEKYSQNLHKNASMQRYFDLILFKLSEKIHQYPFESEHPNYQSFCALRNEIRLSAQENRSIEDICKKMKLSRSYVQHLYKLFFGVSITTDIQSSRIGYAKYLLSSTDEKITGISRACGYENDVHFMRVFKRSTSMTPSEYRKRFRISPSEVEKSQNRHPFDI